MCSKGQSCNNTVSSDFRSTLKKGISQYEVSYKMFCKDPYAVLEEQVAPTVSENIFTHGFSGPSISHAMNSGISRDACTKVEEQIKISADSSLS